MNKLRLDFFLRESKLKLVEGDKFSVRGDNCDVTEFNISSLNCNDPLNSERFITSLAPRKNTGIQPCGDNMPVIVDHAYYGSNISAIASSVEWSENHTNCPLATMKKEVIFAVKTWKPDLEALIKEQDEHDAKPTVTTEPSKTVWDAVNAFEAISYVRNELMARYIPLGWCFNGAKIMCSGHDGMRFTCTTEEFNQCVKELADFANKILIAPTAAFDYEQHKKDNPVVELVKPIDLNLHILNFLDACDIEEGDIEKSGIMLDLSMIRDFVPKYLSKQITEVEPRMKIEYEQCNGRGMFNLQPDFIKGNLYCCYEGDEVYTTLTTEGMLINALYNGDIIYKQVEVEIKTEKRWIAVGSKGFCSNHYASEELCAKHQSDLMQIIEITVDV